MNWKKSAVICILSILLLCLVSCYSESSGSYSEPGSAGLDSSITAETYHFEGLFTPKSEDEWGRLTDFWDETRDNWDEENEIHFEYTGKVQSPSEDDIKVEGVWMGEMPVVNNAKPLQDLHVNTMGLARIFGHFSNTMLNVWTQPYSLAAPNLDNLSFMRKTGYGTYYSIYKLNNGGLVYVFWDRQFDVQTSTYLTEDETIIAQYGAVYLENIRKKSDFNSIQIGSTLDDIISIDSAANMDKLYAQYCMDTTPDLHEYYFSLRLLTDGLLLFQMQYQDGVLVVVDITFFDDYVFKSPILKEQYGCDYPKYLGILPQDFPVVEEEW